MLRLFVSDVNTRTLFAAKRGNTRLSRDNDATPEHPGWKERDLLDMKSDIHYTGRQNFGSIVRF